MNKIYFVRHAPTKANLSGEMLENYDQFDVENFDTLGWWDKVGKNIECKSLHIWVSPTLRCISTAKQLFLVNKNIMKEEPLLKELDCSSLGTQKFWEISKDEFDSICHPDMDAFKKQVKQLLKKFTSESLVEGEAIVCVTHGLFIRHLFNFLTGKGDTELYDLINSRTFKFRNLDMIECTLNNGVLSIDKVYRYD